MLAIDVTLFLYSNKLKASKFYSATTQTEPSTCGFLVSASNNGLFDVKTYLINSINSSSLNDTLLQIQSLMANYH